MSMNSTSRPKVVIVGAGFGGLTAARRIARLPVQVTVVDRKNHHTFQPLLYQVATAGLSPGEIAAPIRWILRSHSNIEVLLEEVVDFNLDKRKSSRTSKHSITTFWSSPPAQPTPTSAIRNGSLWRPV